MALTRTTGRASLRRWLGNRTDLVDADYDLFLNDGLFDLTTRRIHFQSLEKVGASITSVLNQPNYPSPADAFAILHIEDTTNDRVLDRFPGGFEDFLRGRQNQVSAVGNPPTEFIEYGSQLWFGPMPPVAGIVWAPFYYQRATWAADGTATPGIEEEWHQAVLMIARIHAAQEAGDAGRLQLAEAEWQAWLAQRDTARRMQRRHNIPAGGVRPHPNMVDRRWGV